MDESSEGETKGLTKVGYCHPPEHTRFKGGQSGNPRGRPRGALNMATTLAKTLREKVIINERGRRKTVTMLEAAVRQLVGKAAAGELKALQLLAALVRSAEERAMKTTSPGPDFDDADNKVLLGILKRLETSNIVVQGGANEPDTQ